MPPRIKAIFSIIVTLVAIAGYFFQQSAGQIGPSYAALFFGAVAVVSMWIFPEVRRKKSEDTAPKR
jgi:hypothetical protein